MFSLNPVKRAHVSLLFSGDIALFQKETNVITTAFSKQAFKIKNSSILEVHFPP